jgi:hypothetical protein
LQDGESFFYFWLTPPGYRTEPLGGGDIRAGYRIPAEFIASSVLVILAVWSALATANSENLPDSDSLIRK